MVSQRALAERWRAAKGASSTRKSVGARAHFLRPSWNSMEQGTPVAPRSLPASSTDLSQPDLSQPAPAQQHLVSTGRVGENHAAEAASPRLPARPIPVERVRRRRRRLLLRLRHSRRRVGVSLGLGSGDGQAPAPAAGFKGRDGSGRGEARRLQRSIGHERMVGVRWARATDGAGVAATG